MTLTYYLSARIGVFYRLKWSENASDFCYIYTQPRQGTYLKEPLGKRQCLTRFLVAKQLTSLASATLGTERERGDVDMCPVWASDCIIHLLEIKFLAVRYHYKMW